METLNDRQRFQMVGVVDEDTVQCQNSKNGAVRKAAGRRTTIGRIIGIACRTLVLFGVFHGLWRKLKQNWIRANDYRRFIKACKDSIGFVKFVTGEQISREGGTVPKLVFITTFSFGW